MNAEETTIEVREPPTCDESLSLLRLPLQPLTLAAEEDAWQVAQDRVLLYLNVLGIPAHRNLDLAIEAMRRAHCRLDGGGEGHPVPEAMRALREMLVEQRAAVAGLDPGVAASSLAAAPPLNRGSMVPEHMERRPWRAVFARLFALVQRWHRREPLYDG